MIKKVLGSKKTTAVLASICAVLIVLSAGLGTLAYLTDESTVVNTFTVGKVDIELNETATDTDGKPVVDDAGNPVDRVVENEYHLIPGKSYVKDPTITVKKDSEEAYVRMMLTFTNASAVDAVVKNTRHGFDGDYAKWLQSWGWDPEEWVYKTCKVDDELNEITFEFRYKSTVKGAEEDAQLKPLFERLVVPGTVTGEELASLQDNPETTDVDESMKIVVVGHAIQTVGFDNEDQAWEAFDGQMAPVEEN